jgi:hypothetical protein
MSGVCLPTRFAAERYKYNSAYLPVPRKFLHPTLLGDCAADATAPRVLDDSADETDRLRCKQLELEHADAGLPPEGSSEPLMEVRSDCEAPLRYLLSL